MVFSLSRLLFLSLSVTSTLARLPPRSDSIRDVSHRSHTIRSLDTTKDTALDSAPSQPPCTAPQTGYILVSSNTTSLNGYLADRLSNEGTYGSVTNSTEDALRSAFCPDEASGNKTFNIYISSPQDNTPDLQCLGAVQSFAAFHHGTVDQDSLLFGYALLERINELGSDGYADISRSHHDPWHTLEDPRGPATDAPSLVTPPLPSRGAQESSIWTTDLQAAPTMLLTPVWTNPYGSSFLPTLLHFSDLTASSVGVGSFALGNLNNPQSRQPAGSQVSFAFVPSPAAGSKGL